MKRARLSESHILPLENLARKWREETNRHIPHFDPEDGGIFAQALFLFEKPGPKAAGPNGSGFISQDNFDPTARSIKNFLLQANITRDQILIWNAIASWNGTRAINSVERERASNDLRELLSTLPYIKLIIAVGREAERILRKLPPDLLSGYLLKTSLHPSPINRSRRNAAWIDIPNVWRKAFLEAGI